LVCPLFSDPNRRWSPTHPKFQTPPCPTPPPPPPPPPPPTSPTPPPPHTTRPSCLNVMVTLQNLSTVFFISWVLGEHFFFFFLLPFLVGTGFHFLAAADSVSTDLGLWHYPHLTLGSPFHWSTPFLGLVSPWQALFPPFSTLVATRSSFLPEPRFSNNPFFFVFPPPHPWETPPLLRKLFLLIYHLGLAA